MEEAEANSSMAIQVITIDFIMVEANTEADLETDASKIENSHTHKEEAEEAVRGGIIARTTKEDTCQAM